MLIENCHLEADTYISTIIWGDPWVLEEIPPQTFLQE